MNAYTVKYSHLEEGRRIYESRDINAWEAEHAAIEMEDRMSRWGLEKARVESVYILDNETMEPTLVHQSEWDHNWDNDHEEADEEDGVEYHKFKKDGYDVKYQDQWIGTVMMHKDKGHWVFFQNGMLMTGEGGTKEHAVRRVIAAM